MTTMQKYAPPLCWWCLSALPLPISMGLTRMAMTPRLLRPFCSGTLCSRGYGGWFSSSTGQRSGQYVHPIGVAPVPTCLWPQVTNQGYPGLSQFIWWYLWSIPDIKSYSDCGGLKRSHETSCSGRREMARPWDEWNVWHEYLWRDIRVPG